MNDIQFSSTTPVLRIFDIEKAKDFYIQYLGFQLDWEHRFEENFPIYMQVSNGDCKFHLTEHHGDCTPGAKVRVEVRHIHKFHKELCSKNYHFANPDVVETPWETLELEVSDPFGNKIIFYEFLN